MNYLFISALFENKFVYFGLLAFFIVLTLTLILLISLDQKELKKKKHTKKISEEKIEEISEERKQEQEKAKLELEKMIQSMQEGLEEQNEKAVMTYEQEQEEKAIISYQELVNAVRNKTEKIEEPLKTIEHPELAEAIEAIAEQKEAAPIEAVREEKNRKFKTSEFISPVFGKMELDETSFQPEQLSIALEEQEEPLPYSDIKLDETELDFSFKPMRYHNLELSKEENELEHYQDQTLEETLKMKPIPEDIKQNEEFLKALKEFRSSLE